MTERSEFTIKVTVEERRCIEDMIKQTRRQARRATRPEKIVEVELSDEERRLVESLAIQRVRDDDGAIGNVRETEELRVAKVGPIREHYKGREKMFRQVFVEVVSIGKYSGLPRESFSNMILDFGNGFGNRGRRRSE